MRSAALCQLSTLPLPLLIQFIYPKFYALTEMPDSAGVPDETTGDIELPTPINLSSQVLLAYGLYLIDDGQTQFLWVGRDAVPQLIQDVFDVPDRTQLKVGKTTLPVLDNEFNERVRAVIEKSRDHRSKGVGSIVVPSLYVVREDGEPGMKLWAQSLLVEDRAEQGVSLSQWLGMLREKVCPFSICYSATETNSVVDERRGWLSEFVFMKHAPTLWSSIVPVAVIDISLDCPSTECGIVPFSWHFMCDSGTGNRGNVGSLSVVWWQ